MNCHVSMSLQSVAWSRSPTGRRNAWTASIPAMLVAHPPLQIREAASASGTGGVHNDVAEFGRWNVESGWNIHTMWKNIPKHEGIQVAFTGLREEGHS